jgi:signal transduction histidine kinase/CheY-like chemotaxis protein
MRLNGRVIQTEVLVAWVLEIAGSVFIYLVTGFASDKRNSAHRAETSFNILLVTTPNLIALLDSSDRITYIGRAFAEMAGLKNAEFAVGRPFLDLFNDVSMKDIFIDILNQDPSHESTRQIMLNGELHYFRVITTALKSDAEGRLVELIDITPEVRAKFEAEAASRSKSSFLATMSHEIRTPLNAIIGFSEILLQEKLPKEIHKNLEKIHNSGSVLLGIISGILDISKIETGNLELVPVNYAFPSLINDTVHLNFIRIGSKPIVFELDIDETIPTGFMGDELRVKQILNNLLSNALKYTQEGKVILQVRWARPADNPEKAQVIFRVIDTGQGIRKDDIPKLFSQYSQLNTQANRNVEGTGLGLAITRNLVEIMGGDIEVESEFGKGSSFTATIIQEIVDPAPIGSETVKKLRQFSFIDGRRKQRTVARVRMPDCTVLVVDDVQINFDVVRGLLLPYELMSIDGVKSGQEAVDRVRFVVEHPGAPRYDLIFMDHMMPGMDGIEATRLIRDINSEYARKVPIIALTANAIAGNREIFLENGINDFLSKPIDIQKLEVMLEKWIPREKQIRISAEMVLPGAETAPSQEEIPEIEGIDTEKGLDNTGNSPPAYRQLLSIYTGDALERVPQIQTAIETGDFAAYTTMVHALKGISRSIGAEALGDMAAALEEAGRAHDTPGITEKTGEFLDALKTLTGRISAALDASSAREAEYPTVTISAIQFAELKEALLEMNTEKINKLFAEYLSLPLDKPTRELISRIEQDILLFEYESAVRRINAAETGG